MSEITEVEARELYRAVNRDGWRVERAFGTGWVPVVFCDSEATAMKCLNHRIKLLVEWSKMGDEERRRAILRAD